MSMIRRITKEQLAKIPDYVDKWRKMALCTKPTNKEQASATINALYENAGLERPSHILFLKSPIGCSLAKAGMDGVLKTKKPKSMYRLFDMTRKATGKVETGQDTYIDVINTLEEYIGNHSIPKELGLEVTNNLLGDIDNFLCFGLSAYFEHTAYWRIRNEFYPNELNFILDSVFGEGFHRDRNYDYHASSLVINNSICCPLLFSEPLSLYEYCWNELGIRHCKSIQPLINAIQECGWILPFANICFVSSKPEVINLDERGRWHKFGGKALEYGDGWGYWAINGVRMPERHASELPQNWKSQWLLETDNVEQRRVIIGVIGYSKIMHDLGAKQIHIDGDMSLHIIDKDIEFEKIYLLKVRCPSTGTSYALRVPPHVKTCEEARMALMRNSKGSFTFVKET